MSIDKDMMMLRFKTAIDRELKRPEDGKVKRAPAPGGTPAPRTPPRVGPATPSKTK